MEKYTLSFILIFALNSCSKRKESDCYCEDVSIHNYNSYTEWKKMLYRGLYGLYDYGKALSTRMPKTMLY